MASNPAPLLNVEPEDYCAVGIHFWVQDETQPQFYTTKDRYGKNVVRKFYVLHCPYCGIYRNKEKQD